MQTRTNSKALQLLEGVSGWTWIIASLLSVLFFISAIAFHGAWNRVFWSVVVAVISKWLLRGFIEMKQSRLQPSASGTPQSIEIRRKLSELGKLAGIDSARGLSSATDLADHSQTGLEAFAQENELALSRAGEMKALIAQWQELNPGSHDLDQLAEACSAWYTQAAVLKINIAARRRELDPDGERSAEDVKLLKIFDGAQALRNNS